MADEDDMDDWADAMNEQSDSEAETAVADSLEDDSVGVKDVDHEKMDVILDIPVSLSLEVGRTQIPIRSLLQLTQGSVIELDRLAGEPLDVMVNGTLIAHGEVVVVNEKYGIRLTDVMSPSERIKKLR
jgi:flagellar motor switch protein FliN